jgi:hypothetical protein
MRRKEEIKRLNDSDGEMQIVAAAAVGNEFEILFSHDLHHKTFCNVFPANSAQPLSLQKHTHLKFFLGFLKNYSHLNCSFIKHLINEKPHQINI